MKKKYVYLLTLILLVLSMAFTLFGCGETPDPNKDVPNTDTEQGTEPPDSDDGQGSDNTEQGDGQGTEEVAKLTYDMSGVTWVYDLENAFTYNGNEHEVTVSGLPEGVTVKSYANNKKTNAGKYTASVELNYDSQNYNEPTVNDLSWEIKKADITGITFSDKTEEYDSLGHSIELIGNVPAGSTVEITYNDKKVTEVTEVGSYNVVLVITNANYNRYTASATLKITSTEEALYSVSFNGKLYFQNNLDDNKLYCYDGSNLVKVNNDCAQYFAVNGNNLYYYSSSLFSKVIKCYTGETASNLVEINGEYLACDGTYLYYAVNNMLQTSNNGIYKVELSGSEDAIRLVKDKAEYLVCYNGKVYYSNKSDGGKLYCVSTTASELTSGIKLYDEKVSDIILDDGVLYFNSTKTQLGIGVASAIKKYIIDSAQCVKLTIDNGKYLTKVDSYIYYVNKDKITSEIFGDGIYRVSAIQSKDSNSSGTKVISAEDNGYSSLSSDGANLYYYKLNDKHIYSYNLQSGKENDIMVGFNVSKEETTPTTKYAKLAEHNGEIYYINPLDDGCLYKYNIATKTKYKVLANSVSNVYFYNDYMYYSTYVATQYALYRMDLTTNESVKISSSRCDNLIFDGDYIYYVKVGSLWNNHIYRMGLGGENPTELYKDKNLWVASFEKVADDIYFTINPSIGKKYVYKYNVTENKGESLELRSNYMTVFNGIMYYYNIEKDSLNSYNLTTKKDTALVSGVDVNNMIVYNGYLYYSSTKSGSTGLYKYNLSTNANEKLSDKCADGMRFVNGKLYYIQTAVSYVNDYPNNSNGDGNLYCYDGTSVNKL